MTAPETMTKADFACLCNVSPSRVSHWIKEGKIGAEALIGFGRSAQIVVALAQQHLKKRIDLGQRLGNGAETKLDASPFHIQSGTPEQREARLLEILAGMPYSAAWDLARSSVPARVRYAAYLWCKRSVVCDLAGFYPVPHFLEPEWEEIAAETSEAVDLPGWSAWAEKAMWVGEG